MTFLEYVAERLIGPPASRSNGRSTWLCPFHDESNPSFCTLPPNERYKDRFRCFGCGKWGDEYDLMKLFFDRENFNQRRLRLEEWRQDYQREFPSSSLRGPGKSGIEAKAALSELLGSLDPKMFFDTPKIERLSESPLWGLILAARIAQQRNVELADLAGLASKHLLELKHGPEPTSKEKLCEALRNGS